MLVRLIIAAALVAAVVLLARRYRQARARDRGRVAGGGLLPPLPAAWRSNGSERTWVVFTTPYCAACGPLTEHLRAADPEAGLYTVDATRFPELADSYGVRSAPTTVLAGPTGEVLARLVGSEAVTRYLGDALA